MLACRVTDSDRWCRRCGCEGVLRDTVTRMLAHEPFGWRPITRSSRPAATGAPGAGTSGDRTSAVAADPRAELTRGGLSWALSAIVCQYLTVARVAEALGVAWNTANDAVPHDEEPP